MERKKYWEEVYSTKIIDAVGWFQKQATYSLELIRSTGVSHTASVIDVGGGASVLVDDLLAEGYVNLTILDISQTALAASKIRLGSRATNVRWIEMDITKANLPYEVFDIWHDRAVFHFLVTPEDREEYVSCVLRSVKPGGHVIIATFAEGGPNMCSGLSVMQYSPSTLHAQLGEAFSLIRYKYENHLTPLGSVQKFVYCHFRVVGGSFKD